VWLNAVGQVVGVALIIGTSAVTVVGIVVSVRRVIVHRRSDRAALGRDVAAVKQRAAEKWRDDPKPGATDGC